MILNTTLFRRSLKTFEPLSNVACGHICTQLVIGVKPAWKVNLPVLVPKYLFFTKFNRQYWIMVRIMTFSISTMTYGYSKQLVVP
jgi:hypothetical protein